MTAFSNPSSLTILPSPPPPSTAMGLIAGSGRLPIIVAQGLKSMGYPVHGLGLANQYEAELPGLCDSFRDVGLLRIGSWGRILSRMNVRHAIMVGKVDKARLMHDPWRVVRNIPDWRMIMGWYKHLRHDRRSHAVLRTVADELARCGVALLDSTTPIRTEMAEDGVMTRRQPSPDQIEDIKFVWPVLQEALRLDIGQGMTVRERDVIAVEAVEGTDRMIERTGALCRSRGWTMVKGARINHDRRSDVPTVGPDTIRKLYRNGAGCLALAAGDVIIVDKIETIDLADSLGISIIGVPQNFAGETKPIVIN